MTDPFHRLPARELVRLVRTREVSATEIARTAGETLPLAGHAEQRLGRGADSPMIRS